MLKKACSSVLTLLLLVASGSRPGLAQAPTPKPAKRLAQEAKYKRQIVEWGTNQNITVKLGSGEKIEGRLSEIREDSFSVQLVQQGQIEARTVRFSEIHGLSKRGGHQAGKIVGYTVLGGLSALGILAIVAFTHLD